MNKQESKKLEKKVLNTLSKYIKKDNCIIAGISGGPDSIFLLYLLKKHQSKTPCKIISTHINHMIRGKEANKDEFFVKKETEKLKLIFESKKIDIAKLSKKNKKGLEETGRLERYKYFNSLTKKHKANFIITAHHADDNIETVILNLVRGSGLQGLSGMQELEKNIFRPLLDISKNQITEYLNLNKIHYHIEKTNLETIYKRNFIRHKIIPELKNLNPNLANTIAKNSQNIREINNFLKKSAKNWIEKHSLNKDFTKFDAKHFRTQEIALKKVIIREIYQKIIGNKTNIESIHIDEILKLINKNIGNKEKKLGKLKVYLKTNIIIFQT